MTQVKILVTNIHDVTHRAASEAEINVYLKTGWKIIASHPHINSDNGFLMLTTILENEAEQKVEIKEPVKATETTTEKKADPAVKDKAEVKEAGEEKPAQDEKEKPEQEETETTEEGSKAKVEKTEENKEKE